MLKKERNYEFRERMLTIHKENRRNLDFLPNDNEFEIKDGFTIYLSDTLGEVAKVSAMDFIDYLYTSMGVSAMLKKGEPKVTENYLYLTLAEDMGIDLGKYKGYRGYRIDTDNSVTVYANDDRGAAQALYYLEDVMNIRYAPFIKKGTISRKPMYTPQMVHSGFGIDDFPDEHLSQIAHHGRDAILVFVEGINKSTLGFLDFNNLIYRAARYGIDVYAYSYLHHEMNPEVDGAKEYYDNLYGSLFKACPKIKGLILVAESAHFPSKDPNAAATARPSDGIPSLKPSTYYYPSTEYASLVRLIRDAARQYNPDVDVVFWTYNFTQQSVEARMKLIEALPSGISLLSTFEMGEQFKIKDVTEYSSDYTLSRVGFAPQFLEDAQAAQKRGIRMYSMTNTGGMAWDMGMIPYEPMPYQWMKRYDKMLEVRNKYGLDGLMESHHYGIYPSFISKLSDWCFTEQSEEMSGEEILKNILGAEFGLDSVNEVNEALKLWSEAITYCTPTGEDQYGAFRVGPSYPFCHEVKMRLKPTEASVYGSAFCIPYYCEEFRGYTTPISERVWVEIDSLKTMKDLIDKGNEILEKIPNKNEELERLLNLGKYMSCYTETGRNAKIWHTLICKFDAEPDRNKVSKILDEMEALLLKEKKNAEEAIEYVELDSRLGWEPGQDYLCDKAHIEWKLKSLNYVLEYEIKNFRKSVAL